MRLNLINGDSQDKVYSLYYLATALGNGRECVKTLLDKKKKFGLTKEEIKNLKGMGTLLDRCWREFILEIR